MAATKRNRAQIEQDQTKIADLWLKGWSENAIAAEVHATQQMISYDLRAVKKHWHAVNKADQDKLKDEELARVDHLRREYWDAWKRSLGTIETGITKRTIGAGGQKDEATFRHHPGEGNPAFLAGVQWCIDRRCKLLGLDAGDQSERDLNAAIERELASLAERRKAADAQAFAGNEPGDAGDSAA